jgi:hypothetical protein
MAAFQWTEPVSLRLQRCGFPFGPCAKKPEAKPLAQYLGMISTIARLRLNFLMRILKVFVSASNELYQASDSSGDLAG